MEYIKQEYEIPKEFMERMEKMTFKTFECDYNAEENFDKKKLRNDYQNRMKKTNILIYYMDHLNTEYHFDKEYLKEELKKKVPKKDNIKFLIEEI